ncbi:glycosyltransferase family 2 protein [Pantanalinema sp. GBBB05]|uniref:glycosyltransferase family 2 protein n=1 Tax=Pantanalinema sp. GBBB05 TaxID=2604139 RepID=UPI001D96FAF4|nr:glycosyltransferase [Pantanalinema sp. GBBB05]
MGVSELLLRIAEAGLLVVAGLLLIPSLTLFIECIAALLPQRPSNRKRGDSALSGSPLQIDVLVPAHNESAGISNTLNSVLPQLAASDRLVVIADNCTDNTAEVVRSIGATAIERQDTTRRGKGYALDFGIQYLAQQPPDVIVFMDADCIAEPGAIAQITQQARITNRPVQAIYLLEQPAKASPKHAVSGLAFTVKNLVRPLGLANLGLPCLLTGTGMAFPWASIQQVSLASGNIVEDMNLGLDLAIAGYAPTFCASATVIGVLPQQAKAAESQRTRWEHGHLQTLLTQVPRLLKASIRQRRFDLLAIALDLLIPPLSLLVMLWALVMGIALLTSWLGASIIPVVLLGIQGGLILTAILAAWAKFCRRTLPLTTLLAIPLYIFWKIPLYLAFLIKPQTKWVRTARDPHTASSEPPSVKESK